MTYDEFKNLSEEDQLVALGTKLDAVDNPAVVFGADFENAKDVYRALAKELHPDAHPDYKELSTVAFERLGWLWARAEKLNKRDQYGKDMPVDTGSGAPVVSFDGIDYQVGEFLGSGDIADLWEAQDSDGNYVVVKAARDNTTDDLMLNESHALGDLAGHSGFSGDDGAQNHIPFYVGSTASPTTGLINILQYSKKFPRPSQVYSLKNVGEFFGNKIDPVHIGWIWRRMMAALTHAHFYGYVHAAINPDNIMIDPQQHGGMLIDWVHASKEQEVVKTISSDWRDLYPPEFFDKNPPLPTTDLYMMARSMQYVSRDMPDAMNRYFNWVASEGQYERPDKMKLLFSEWNEVLYKRLGFEHKKYEMEFDLSSSAHFYTKPNESVDFSWWW